ncbi:hypothetical protein BDR26DRAFT_205392 [Obelidium mucronatum]|nr:hypothetical protein BDR26DRAFT_205392 [Obelidium mucronatum]
MLFVPSVAFVLQLFHLSAAQDESSLHISSCSESRQLLIVVIALSERMAGQDYAGITLAVRALTDNHKVRVIVGASPNSSNETLTRTERAIILNVEPMPQEVISVISQFSELFSITKKNNFDGILFGVLGGNPAKYIRLWENFKGTPKKGSEDSEIIGKLLCEEIYAAVDLVGTAMKAHPQMKNIIELFDKEKGEIADRLLAKDGLQQPTLDKVFRKVKRNNIPVLIPSSNGVGIVLCHGLERQPTLNELKSILNKCDQYVHCL